MLRTPFCELFDIDAPILQAAVWPATSPELVAAVSNAGAIGTIAGIFGTRDSLTGQIERIDGFPPEEAEGLLHIILSHHGKLEHGSPVVPCTREATLVHFVDNLGGNLGSFDRIERTLADGASWSDFDRGISTSAFFGPREKARREEAA